MAEARSLNPLVEQFRRGGVPREMRLMAAQGVLPLKPEDLLELWTNLVGDPDEVVRTAAEASLTAFPPSEEPHLASATTGRAASTRPILKRGQRGRIVAVALHPAPLMYRAFFISSR